MKKKTENNVRIDKWLWAVRIYKTRSKATTACKKGRVTIENIPAKPSRNISLNEIIDVKKPPVNYKYRIKGLLNKRQSAKLAAKYFEDLTPQDELDKLKVKEFTTVGYRRKGEGRPTKKERRILDNYKNKLNI